MAVCLITKNPEVKKQLDEYTDILGSYDAAYYVLSENNGYGLEYAPNGLPSKLFSDLLSHFNGDRDAAILAKSKVFTDSFKNWFTGLNKKPFKLKGGDIVFGHPAIGKTYSVEQGMYSGRFIDWDVEYNHKRDKWIEEHSNTKKGTPEYKKARNEYLIYPEKYPDYVEFLTEEWNRVKDKALSENKILIASPHTLLKMFTEDFDYIINLEASDFINRNMSRGGDKTGSVLWKEGIDNTISNVTDIPIMVLGEGLYFEDLLKQTNVSETIDENGEPLVKHVLNQERTVYHQTEENRTIIPRDFLTDREFRHMQDALTKLFPEIRVLWHLDLPEGEYGRIDTTDLEAITIMLSDNYQADTLPHEYAHRYIEMFRDTPIVQKAIKKFGSEEALVQAIGELVVMQKGDAYNFFLKLWLYTKAVFSKDPVMKRALLLDLANAFLLRKDLAKGSNILSKVATQGSIYFQRDNGTKIYTVRKALQEMANKITFDVDLHKYFMDGKELFSVSSWKEKLLYSVYDDSDISENQKSYNDNSRVIGTTIHAVLESMFTGKYRLEAFTKPIYNVTTGKLVLAAMSKKALQQLEKIYDTISKKYEVVASEAMLADANAGVAGTTDLVLYNKETKKFGIFDYKTKCIELDGKKENKDGKKLWGFSYVNRSKSGAKTATNAYDFQLLAYQYMLEQALSGSGIKITERGIIPIVYKFDSKTETVTDAFFTKKMGTYEVDPEEGVYHIASQESVKYDVLTRVFGQISDKFDEKYIKDRIATVSLIISEIIKSLKNKAVIDKMSGRRTQSRYLEHQLDLIGNVSEVEAMLKYVSTAAYSLRKAYDDIIKNYQKEALKGNNVVWKLSALRDYKELALSFNMVDDISGFMQRFYNFFTEEEIEKIQDAIKEVNALQKNILNAYKDVGIRLYMDSITPYANNIEAEWRLNFEREYRENNKKVDKEELDKYVNKKILEHREEIDIKTREWLQDQMKTADGIFECSTIAANIGTVFQSRDPFVQASVKYFDERMLAVDHEKIKIERLLLKLVDEYEKKYKGGNWSNHRNLYDDMIEIIDGQAYLVSEIPNSYRVAKAKMYDELNLDHTLTFAQREEKIKAWYDENAPIYDIEGLNNDFKIAMESILSDLSEKDRKKLIDNILATGKNKRSWDYYYNKQLITIQLLDEIKEAYHDLLDLYRVINTSKFKNEKYDKLMKLKQSDDVKYRLWLKFIQINNRGDLGVTSRKLLDYRLPGIRKTFVERASEKGIVGAKDGVVNWVKENATIVEDETMQGQAFTDMNGNMIREIPLFFNGRLTLDDQSFDLPTIYMRWIKSAMEYQAKVEMEDYLLMTAEILKERTVKTNKKSILSKRQGKDEEALTKGENTYKLFASWLDQVFYGNQVNTTTDVGNVSIHKIAELFMKYHSMRVMGVNYVSMINNLTVAELNQLVEAMGSKWIDMKSFRKANTLYSKHVVTGSMFADIGKRAPEDFINQLSEWFGIFNEGDSNLRAKGLLRLATTDVLFWTTNVGEHISLSTFLLAALYKLKAKDKNGNVLGDMIDFLSFDENGQLQVDQKVANFDSKRQQEFGIGIRSSLISMHGNYADRYKVAIQLYIWGKMALMFRKWIYTSFQRRFGKRYYDNIRGEWVEGYHSTLLRLGKSTFYNPAADKIKVMFGMKIDLTKRDVIRWNTLTEAEKHNIYKSISEIMIFTIAYLFSRLFRGMADGEDDDDSKNLYMNISYQLYRVYTDFTFYFNPWSFTTIVQDPFPVLAAVDNLGRLYDRIFDPTAVYTTGKNAHENKLLYSLGQMIPVYRQIDRWSDIQYEFDFLTGKN